MPGFPVYSGVCNLATGNLQLSQRVCGWGGKGGGLDFSLFFNSQSGRSSPLGPKWTHSFNWFITGTNPAVVVSGDGTETSYSLVNGQYVAPTGIYDSLVHNGDSTWTLTLKGGTQYRFRTDGLLGSIVDTNGNTITLTYGGSTLTQVTDAAGRNLVLSYTSGKLTGVTDAESRLWTISFDGSNRVYRVTTPSLGGQTYYTQFGYGTNNNVASATNRLNRTWQYSYASNNVLASTTDPGAHVVQISYSGGGGEGPSGGDFFTTDVDANLTGTDGSVTKYTMDTSGRPAAITDGSGDQTGQTFDASHNLTGRTLPSGVAWSYTFDGRGNRLTETDPLNKTVQMTYSNDLLTSIQDPVGNLTQFAYDSHGNQTQITDPAGAVTNKAYNPDGSLASVTDPASKVTSYQYDANGNPASVTDPLNNVASQVWQNTLLASRTDARNRTTQYAYDSWGRLTGITYPQGGGAAVTLSYDVEGRLTQAADGTGTRTFTYDDWGRKIGCTSPAGNSSATYDAVGRLTAQTDVSGRQIQYQYDSAARLTQVSDPNGAATYGWTVDGNVAVENYPNGTRKEVNYDNARRVSSIVHRVVATQAVIVSYTATYDDAGKLTQVTEQPSGDVTTFSYDQAGRILSENRTGQRPYTSVYTYNSRGNRLTAVRSENGVVSHNGAYSYDDASRLIQCIDSATQITEVYTWNPDSTLASYPGPGYTRLCEYDEEQRLIRIKKDYGGGNVVTAYEYGYGYDGLRRWRKDYAGNVWTRYPCGAASCAGDLIEQSSDLSGVTWGTSASYLKGIAIVRRNSEYHHFDLTGTAGVITDSGHNILSNNLYDAFGVQRFASGSAQSQWRLFACSIEADEGIVGTGGGGRPPGRGVALVRAAAVPIIGVIIAVGCALACACFAWAIKSSWDRCHKDCEGLKGNSWYNCMLNCTAGKACGDPAGNLVNFAACIGCMLCICVFLLKNFVLCKKLAEKWGL